MIVRSALGRVGLRLHPIGEERFWSKVMKVYAYMSHTFNDYMRQVIEEQDSIGSDREYVEILDKVRMRRQ
jgi:predicted thioredoxin/glutaredoxin